MQKTADIITAELDAAGCDSPDPELLTGLLQHVFTEYRDHQQFFSTDTMLTRNELAKAASGISEHLTQALTLAYDPHVLTWLDEFVEDKPDDGMAVTKLVEALITLKQAAADMAEHFDDSSAKLLVTDEDGEHHHQRKTRTQSRDKVLIPGLVLILQRVGLELRIPEEHELGWGLEALDLACVIIERILAHHGIASPAAGDTMRGEHLQGRLRRMVKEIAESQQDIFREQNDATITQN